MGGGRKKTPSVRVQTEPFGRYWYKDTVYVYIYIYRHVNHPNEHRIHHDKFPSNLPSMKFTLISQKLHQRWMVPWWNITQPCWETTSCSKPLLGFQFQISFRPKRIRYASSNYERKKNMWFVWDEDASYSVYPRGAGRAKNLNASLLG